MNRLDMKSRDSIKESLELMKYFFPNAYTVTSEGEKIDFDILKQEMQNIIVEGNKEKYQINWPGKKEAILNANALTSNTLRAEKEKSFNFDETENIYIEGDNLEALKILQESYLNKIKCIYIDPPYNTGNDFIYNDDFKISSETELINSGQIDDMGNRLITNNASNGKFHSDWMSMIYSRLKLARNLLKEDGIIFVSIGSQEVENLGFVMNEIFGENNKISLITRVQKKGGNKGAFFNPTSDYIYVYAKNIDCLDNFVETNIDERIYNKVETEGPRKGEKYAEVILYMPNLEYRPNQRFYVDCPDGSRIIPPEGKSFRWSEDRFKEEMEKGSVLIKPSKNSQLIKEDGTKADYIVYQKRFLSDTIEKGSARPNNLIENYPNTLSSKELAELNIPFDYAKPVELVKYLLKISKCKDNDIIMDFFSGSASTAQAVMELNIEDGGKRKFIMVQLPEKCDEKSDAFKKGFNTICEIGEQRIKNAGSKLKDDSGIINNNFDNGFRVFRIDSSNMKDVYYKPSEISQTNLFDLMSNIKEDRTSDDLLTQVILDLGLTLDLKIEERNILNNKVYLVADNALIACFDDKVNIDIIDEICKYNPLKVVFKDISFKTDKDKINLEERIKKLSPDTEISIL